MGAGTGDIQALALPPRRPSRRQLRAQSRSKGSRWPSVQTVGRAVLWPSARGGDPCPVTATGCRPAPKAAPSTQHPRPPCQSLLEGVRRHPQALRGARCLRGRERMRDSVCRLGTGWHGGRASGTFYQGAAAPAGPGSRASVESGRRARTTLGPQRPGWAVCRSLGHPGVPPGGALGAGGAQGLCGHAPAPRLARQGFPHGL